MISTIEGLLVDQHTDRIYPARLTIEGGIIARIEELKGDVKGPVILPCLVDSHIHIEDTNLNPAEYVRLAAVNGQIAAIADPHEIANVLGEEGEEYMLRMTPKTTPTVFYTVPSCVPCCGEPIETAGAHFTPETVEHFATTYPEQIVALGEVMNFVGVLNDDTLMRGMIETAKNCNLVLDGHAPGVKGEEARNYFKTGISTDHETLSIDEAKDKLRLGVKIQLRGGSLLEEASILSPLLDEPSYEGQLMLCTDDCDCLAARKGTILQLAQKLLKESTPETFKQRLFSIIKASNLVPVAHYNLRNKVGTLKVGDPADFLVLDARPDTSLFDNGIKMVYVRGEVLVSDGAYVGKKQAIIGAPKGSDLGKMSPLTITKEQLAIKGPEGKNKCLVRVIRYIPHSLVTESLQMETSIESGVIQTPNDCVKVVVASRYVSSVFNVGFLANYRMIADSALSVTGTHDSHNVIVVGTSDSAIELALQAQFRNGGGYVVVEGTNVTSLPLRVGGVVSDEEASEFIPKFEHLSELARKVTVGVKEPIHALSFFALPVIPALKITDRGLFDVTTFSKVPLVIE